VLTLLLGDAAVGKELNAVDVPAVVGAMNIGAPAISAGVPLRPRETLATALAFSTVSCWFPVAVAKLMDGIRCSFTVFLAG
jgi:hypothetical protein